VEAGEFADEDYLRNPYRRCFHCKQHLYTALAAAGQGVLLSGTNTDDLGDFRPGLEAAAAHGVRHPYVECGLDKAAVRRLAARLGYPDLAELPAAPCLSSRIQTGLRIDPAVLGFVDRVEESLRRRLAPQVVRCRVQADAIAVQLDADSLEDLDADQREGLRRHIRGLAIGVALPAEIRFAPYRRGSAFIAES